ncbi:baseplate J/gp47 family protein [Dinghuibacter silviterrae]|uniref:Baseplate J-like protein n=1 Tax=Dinghuibacter silviterrae TaxID=1539049 RepID=A0A4R8DV37_9BACT|nr:hypothetical protein [Dinghuibacter silviterrae]TDX01277.1 hypothetical protein EDB95_2310 [Dinghuibacter silviterrae]
MTSSLSQRERLKAALIPDNLEIEERTLEDWLLLVASLSREFALYGFDDKPVGDWEPFFTGDLHFWSAVFSKMPVLELGTVYERLLKSLQAAGGGAEGIFRSMVQMVEHTTDQLAGASEKIGILPTQDALGDMARFLSTNRTEILQGLQSEAGSPDQERVLEQLHQLFTEILTQFNLLRETALQYLETHPILEGTYSPHLGLLLAFLHVFRHLRTQINHLTREHLDFYYRDVLGIVSLQEVPDKVHVLFEPDLNMGRILLPGGTGLLAKIPGVKDPVPYTLAEDLMVNKCTVASLKTVCISENPVFFDDTHQPVLSNFQVYQGDYPVLSPAQYLKSTVLPPTWPVFGEGQENLGEDQRTMTMATLGLMLGSPLFYLPEGKREIHLTFYFESASFKSLLDYLHQFSVSAGKTVEAVLGEVMTHAWTIAYTGPTGWVTLDDYTVQLPESPEDSWLLLCMYLAPDAPAMMCYNPALHTGTYQTHHPLLRLLANPENSHNAYSFFKGLVMERIQIRSCVEGFRDVQLQNANGNLSPQSPFQPFGPLPFVGSYLDIRNSNVFNRYTSKIHLTFQWLELPKVPGGFATYYDAYGTKVRNSDFRVSIGALSEGQCRPQASRRQEMSLFAVNNEEQDILEDENTLEPLDTKRLEMVNIPLQEKDALGTDAFFRNGAIRLELLGPPDAFGHALFPRVFPEIIQHNVRYKHDKLPLPNPPYTPKVKTITIDYNLEYAEAFKEGSKEANGSGGLDVFHLYPFGFRKVYPVREQQVLSFIPTIDSAGNLYIGLNAVAKEGELSLLFQLEESNFHHTLHTTEVPSWSYLRDNTWVPFPGMYVLTDTTNRFINSGQVKIRIPNDINTKHTAMPTGLFWLRVSVQGKTDIRSRVVGIYTQAALAQRVLDGTTPPLDRDFRLPPGSIQEFAHKVRGIQQIYQVFPSFGGQPAETHHQYYTRVSERLRHKERPLTALDIEQWVLQRFPSLSVVKCFGAGPTNPGVYPGVNLQVIVIPAPGPDLAGRSDRPQASLATLLAIKNALIGVLSPFVQVEVGNPIYERVKVVCSVRFSQAGGPAFADRGSFLKKLHDDLKQHICPWLFEADAASQIGADLYLSELMAFIKKRPYIQEVTGFSLVHFFEEKNNITGELSAVCVDTARTPTSRLRGSVREAILVPSEQHLITVLDEPAFEEPRGSGIGDFILGRELLVSEPRPLPVFPPPSERMEDPEEYIDLTLNPIV